jgi:hypothetical protein
MGKVTDQLFAVRILYNYCKLLLVADTMRSSHITANRKVISFSVGVTCARQDSSEWVWLAVVGRKASDALSTYLLHGAESF